MRIRNLSTVVIGLLVLGACASSTTTELAPTPTTGTTPTHRVDWTSGGSEIALGDDLRIAACESGPRQLCVRLGSETIGTAELNDYPLTTMSELQRAKARGASDEELLRLHADDFTRIFVEERPQVCGADHVVQPRPASPASFGGKTGIAYGFDTLRGGEVVERVRTWAVLDADSLFVFGTTGVKPGSCMDDSELAELDLQQLDRVLPVLQAVVGNSSLPKPLMCTQPGVAGAVPC